MADVLTRIVERKRVEVESRRGHNLGASPTKRSLKAALAKPGARFIMEVKRKSPSGHRARHSLERAVAAYAPVADAISVLTDGADFGGSIDDLRSVRERFDGPILAKDFVVDPVQVAEARAAGADAVLVMMSVLDDRDAQQVLAVAKALSMDALVEVRDEDELARALALGADLIGINNRDLKTLKVDLEATERLTPKVPKQVTLVCESGILSRDDVIGLSPSVDAFLVGSSLMAADDIVLAARALVFGQVKICGLTRVEDVAAAARAGATHAGFIFHPVSPRRVSVDEVRMLVGAARNAGLRSVGVFAADGIDPAMVARDLGLDAVQIHGEIAPDLKSRLGAIGLIGVRSVKDGKVSPPVSGVDGILFDHRGGGSGKPFDWGLIAGDPDLPRAFIGGGITPAKAAQAASIAAGIDLSSGVETAPGLKDVAKIEALFAALRPASRSEV